MKERLRRLLPEIIIGLVLTIVITVFFWGSTNYEYRIVNSDGRGYYAYLPAVFVQHDMSFQETYEAEKKEFQKSFSPFHLIKGENGRTFNKYYPGVAIMQAPFFLMAYLIESTYSNDITGYSILFLKFLQIGSIFYFMLGFFYLRKYLTMVTENKRSALLASIFIALGTNVFFLVIVKTSFSHHLSFCLFAAFAFHIRKYFETKHLKNVIYVGLILGLIVLVRPLNVLVVFAIPIILLSWKNVQSFFGQLFKLKNGHLALSFMAFFSVLCVLFLLNFLSSGNMMNWSYDGEGFDFSDPHFWTLLFSYRIGIFVHAPLLILSLAGCYFLFKKHKEAFVFLIGYLVLITYIMSCWWSWDYGGFYGNRVYAEHLVFFAIPLAFLFRDLRFKKGLIAVACIFTLFMWSRAYQINAQITPHRFTAETYFKSILRLDESSKGDFAFVQDVPPHGSCSATYHLTSVENTPLEFGKDREFGMNYSFKLPEDHAHKRYYFTAKINKTLDSESDWKEVFLIMDWYDTLSTHREYHSVPLYEYYKEGRGVADELIINQEQYMNPVNDLNLVNMYIWNPQKKEFTINAMEFTVEEYSPEVK